MEKDTLISQMPGKFSKQSDFNLALPLCSFSVQKYGHRAGKFREREVIKRHVGHATRQTA